MLTRFLMLCGCFGALGMAVELNQLTDAERSEGWRLLFDGKSTSGWVEITGKPFPANCWMVEDGSLKATCSHRWVSRHPHSR